MPAWEQGTRDSGLSIPNPFRPRPSVGTLNRLIAYIKDLIKKVPGYDTVLGADLGTWSVWQQWTLTGAQAAAALLCSRSGLAFGSVVLRLRGGGSGLCLGGFLGGFGGSGFERGP